MDELRDKTIAALTDCVEQLSEGGMSEAQGRFLLLCEVQELTNLLKALISAQADPNVFIDDFIRRCEAGFKPDSLKM